ncbi:MAG TPA: HDOD domain-containing protein [Bryobacteraceae bacterium]|nr:HDOD domain-containing protein [Bryobacteraceae bacterium]
MPPHSKTATPPATVEVLVHCRRTAAVAKRIADGLALPPGEQALLGAACRLHHHSVGLLAPKSVQRLLADVFGEAVPGHLPADPVPGTVREVLRAYEVPGSGGPQAARLGGILRLADAFDQDMEAQPITGKDPPEILEGLRGGVEAGLWTEEAMNALAEAIRPRAVDGLEFRRVPVFPQAALRMLSLMRDPRASVVQVVKAASLDPAAAGLLLQLANSALFGSRTPLSTLSRAITRLGFATAQKVILSAALRPLFGNPKLQAAWPHSLEVADLSEQLAAQAGGIDPAEAYLAGLIHDVGRIALLALPLAEAARLHALERDGCPPLYAETLTLGTDHAALGGQIVSEWRLPDHLVAAVRRHHQPEKADHRLASLLYLAEFLSGSEEDLPSIVRLQGSLHGLGLAWDQVAEFTVSALGCWLAAA